MSTAAPDRSAVLYYAVEWTRAKVAIRSVVAPAHQPEPASRLKSATRDVRFLRSNSRCRRCVSNLSNVTPRYFVLEQKGRKLLLRLTFSSRLASLLLIWIILVFLISFPRENCPLPQRYSDWAVTNSRFLSHSCTHCTPTSNTTTFHNSISGDFVVYQDRFERKLLQLLGHQKIQKDFL